MPGSIVRRIFLSALLGGAVAGVAMAVGYHLLVVPIVIEAEGHENTGSGETEGHPHGLGTHEHEHGHGAWAPDDGMGRTISTTITSLGAGIGFALLLTACHALRGRVNWRQGVVWGLVGFVTFNVAPALGLPPVLPGAATADLEARQFWWVATVVLAGGGLAMIAFAPGYFRLIGVVPLILPHLVGAPQPEQHGGSVPAELEQVFIYMSLLANGGFWIVLGASTAYLFDRFGDAADAT